VNRIHAPTSAVEKSEGDQVSAIWVLAAAAVWLVVAMAGAWALQRATRNAGWVDAVWSGATGLGAALAALAPVPGAGGVHVRQVLAAAMAASWGARLAWHIYLRTKGGGPEDVRYATFRREWGADFEKRLFSFLMIQAAAAWVLVLTVFVAARNGAPGLGLLDLAAVALLAGSVAGEGQADAQLQRFRQAGSGGICDVGLWGWSRHPNYFFEFLGWCAYPLLALSGGGERWAIALLGPAMMFWLLRYVSGVPPLEAAMLARRGEAFREYQARVSVFFPWPGRKKASASF
jgi:steroid 5-alpha reductase family enzyme